MNGWSRLSNRVKHLQYVCVSKLDQPFRLCAHEWKINSYIQLNGHSTVHTHTESFSPAYSRRTLTFTWHAKNALSYIFHCWTNRSFPSFFFFDIIYSYFCAGRRALLLIVLLRIVVWNRSTNNALLSRSLSPEFTCLCLRAPYTDKSPYHLLFNISFIYYSFFFVNFIIHECHILVLLLCST